jgi:DNA-binding NarL/FixJ family response regulator
MRRTSRSQLVAHFRRPRKKRSAAANTQARGGVAQVMAVQWSNSTGVMIVDDRPVFRLSLMRVLKDCPLVCVQGSAENWTGAFALDEDGRAIGLVLTTVRVLNRVSEAERRIMVEKWPGRRIVAFGSEADTVQPQGLDVTVVPECGTLRAFFQACGMPRAFARMQEEELSQRARSLSQREREVYLATAHGRQLKEIAAELEISTTAVHTYRRRAMEKLGLRTEAELVKLGAAMGVTSCPCSLWTREETGGRHV